MFQKFTSAMYDQLDQDLSINNSDGNHSNNYQDCALEEVLNLQVFNEEYSVCNTLCINNL